MASSEALQTSNVTPEGAIPPAVEAASHSWLRRVVETPVQLGRGALTIVMNGNIGEALSSSASHLH